MGEHEPLRVTAYMAGGVAVPHPFILDGPLNAAIVRELCTERGVDEWDLGQWVDGRDHLPLKIQRSGRHWFTHCSDAQYEVFARSVQHWTKRFDLDHAVEVLARDRSVNLKSGRYRIHRQPLYMVVTDRIDWHCVGDGERIQHLLSTWIHGLGKKRAHGHGAVMRWEVEPESEDRSLRREDGSLARPLPLPARVVGHWMDSGELVGTETERLQASPPYWNGHCVAECVTEGRWTTDHPSRYRTPSALRRAQRERAAARAEGRG